MHDADLFVREFDRRSLPRSVECNELATLGIVGHENDLTRRKSKTAFERQRCRSNLPAHVKTLFVFASASIGIHRGRMPLTSLLVLVAVRSAGHHGCSRSGSIDADETDADQCVTCRQWNVVRHEQGSIVPPASASYDLIEDNRSVMRDFEAIGSGSAFADDGLAHVRRNLRQLFLALSSAALNALGTGRPREPQYAVC